MMGQTKSSSQTLYDEKENVHQDVAQYSAVGAPP